MPASQAHPAQLTTVYAHLKQDIITGALQPGEQLLEIDTAVRLGVSRTPVREALRRLEHDGLVVANARGMAVRERSPDEILEIYEARIVLESAVARAAAERRTETDVMRLVGMLRRGEAVPTDQPDEMAEANLAFHQAVWAAGHNNALADLLERLNLHLTRYPATTLSRPGRWESAHDEHTALVDAIRDRDSERASVVATEHFSAARDIRIAMWQEEMAATP